MYPWYRDSMSQLGQFCSGGNLPAPTAAHIKTENGYNDCMLALDYAQNKVRYIVSLQLLFSQFSCVYKINSTFLAQSDTNLTSRRRHELRTRASVKLLFQNCCCCAFFSVLFEGKLCLILMIVFNNFWIFARTHFLHLFRSKNSIETE